MHVIVVFLSLKHFETTNMKKILWGTSIKYIYKIDFWCEYFTVDPSILKRKRDCFHYSFQKRCSVLAQNSLGVQRYNRSSFLIVSERIKLKTPLKVHVNGH
jgi:hypothetical protein